MIFSNFGLLQGHAHPDITLRTAMGRGKIVGLSVVTLNVSWVWLSGGEALFSTPMVVCAGSFL